jgi:signal peptidase I
MQMDEHEDRSKFTIGPPSPEQNQVVPRFGLIRLILSWSLILFSFLFIQHYIFQSYQVYGQSMEPALSEGDFLVVSKISKSWAQATDKEYTPARGDVVVLDDSLIGSRLIKRVIALPTERIQIANGKVTVYNQKNPSGFDPYKELGLNFELAHGTIDMIVPPGHVFVMGDNRIEGGSLDSRNQLGPVPVEFVSGKLIVRIWPVSDIGLF